MPVLGIGIAAGRGLGGKGPDRLSVKLYPFLRLIVTFALLCAAVAVMPGKLSAQGIDFGQIDKFESLGPGSLHVGSPPKTIIDDSDRHTVILTIWDADAETKVYWKSLDGNDRTTVIPGKGV